MGPRVLIADDDAIVCRILEKTLKTGGFEAEVASHGADALERLSAPDAPRLVLLDWQMPRLSGLEVCRKLRESPAGAGAYVFLMSGRQGGDDTLRGFDAGVDEFLAKPFEPQAVLARLRAVERRLRCRDGRGVLGLLNDASQGETGEVVVRSEGQVGRVIFHLGKVAWVHVPGGGSLLPFLAGLGLTEDDARQALEECRVQRLPFLDTLADWGLVPREGLRERFRDELASRLAALLALPDLVGFFVPGSSPFQSGFSCELAEIEPPSAVPPSAPRLARLAGGSSRPVSQALGALASEVARLDGVLGVTLIDFHSGVTLLSKGQPCNRDLVLSMARLFQVEAGEHLEKSMVASEGRYHLLRRVSEDLLLYAQIDRVKNPNIGLIQFAIRQRLKSA